MIYSKKGVHKQMEKMFGKPSFCEHCKTTDASKRYDWANKDLKYSSPDRSFWMRLCRRCHRIYDLKFNYPFYGYQKLRESRKALVDMFSLLTVYKT